MNLRWYVLGLACGLILHLNTTSSVLAQCSDCEDGNGSSFSSCESCDSNCDGCYGLGNCEAECGGGRRGCFRAKMAARRACRKAKRDCSTCLDSSGCFSEGDCGDTCCIDSCGNSYGFEYESGSYGGHIIDGETYDPESVGRPIIIDETEQPVPADSAHLTPSQRSLHLLASHQESVETQRQPPQFAEALSDYHIGDFHGALYRLTEAVEQGSKDPLTRYLLALCHYQIGDTETAQAILREAIKLEAKNPIANWGQRMERIQGRARVWVERARQAAFRGL